MARKLPTGISSRVNDSGGRSRRQYRAFLSDSTQRTATGKPKQVSSRWFDSLAEAREWRDDKTVQLKQIGTLAQDNRLAVGDACDAWLEVAEKVGIDGRAPVEFATAERYRSTIRNVVKPSIGLVRLADLNPPKVTKWRDQLVVEHGHDAARRALGVLKMVTRYHVTIGALLIDAASSVRLSRAAKASSSEEDGEDRAVEEFLQPDEVARILAAVDRIAATGKLKRDEEGGRGVGEHQQRQRLEAWQWVRPLVYLLVLGGPRMGEASALRWGDVDWDKKTISITRALKRGRRIGAPKNKTSIRTLRMGDKFMGVLRQLYVAKNQRQADDYIFGGEPRRPLNDANFRRRQWHDLMVECGMVSEEGENAWTPHDLRHYHASVLIYAGKPDVQIANRLGHANTIVTRTVYAHLFRELEGEANMVGADLEDELLGR